MNKKLILISSPINTFSGYGASARDIVRALFRIYPDADFKFISLPWGNTPLNALNLDIPDEKRILDNILVSDKLSRKPDIFIQISVPNEFHPNGVFNIGITAGIESTIASAAWIDGLNKMDLIIVPSKFSRDVLASTQWNAKRKVNNQTQILKLEKEIRVLFEGYDSSIYKKIESIKSKELNKVMSSIEEDFVFLSVGHWIQGDLGHDRKDIGMLIKTFIELFKDKDKKPALLLKTSGATPSILDREQIMGKINNIKKLFKSKDLPNIYILHGILSDEEMNELYNHKKVKSLISFTHGEGYGRPIAEFSTTGKPILVSKFSGHLDFLSSSAVTFLDGELIDVHKSALVKNIFVEKAKWFKVDYEKAKIKLRYIFEHYNKVFERSKKQSNYIKQFTLEKMTEELSDMLKQYISEERELILPELPKLTKVE